MPSKLIADTLLREINKASGKARRLRTMAENSERDACAAETALSALLDEARRQNVYFIMDKVTGIRRLDPPTKGWD